MANRHDTEARPGTGLVGRGKAAADPAVTLEAMGGEFQFLHAVLCQVGLPRRQTEGRVFERTSGAASLRVEAGVLNDGTRWVEQPLPYGAKPRLALLHVCSEAIRTKSPVVEIEDSASDFLRALGLHPGGHEHKRFRKQMQALAACRMQLGYMRDGKSGTIKCDPIERFEAWVMSNATGGQRAMWPGEIELSGRFFETLREHAVPLERAAIRQLQGSALALDVYTWLAHRLCRLRHDGGQVLPWAALRAQFGQEYADEKDFKRRMLEALRKVHGVYPSARLEQVRGGVKVFPSPPPVRRRSVVVPLRVAAAAEPPALPHPAASASPAQATVIRAGDVKPVSHPDPERIKRMISEEALQDVAAIAPGWCKHMLLDTYAGWLARERKDAGRAPDKAFHGWVRRFTKGKRPA